MILAIVANFYRTNAQNTYTHSMASDAANGKLSPTQSLHEVRRVYGVNDNEPDYPVSVWRFPAARTKAIIDAAIDANFRNSDGSVLAEAQKADLVGQSTIVAVPANYSESSAIQLYDADGNASLFVRPLHPGEQGIAYQGRIYLLVSCLNGFVPKKPLPVQAPPAQDVWTAVGTVATPPPAASNSYSYSPPAAGVTTNSNTAAPITITITNPASAPAAPVVIEQKKEGNGLLAGIIGFGAGILADRFLFNNNDQSGYYPQQAAYNSGYVYPNQNVRPVYNPGHRGGNGGSTGGGYNNGWFVGPSNGNGTNQPIINNPAPYIPSGQVRRW